MKKSTKRIAMLAVIVLLASLMTAAFADDRIFTSETFSIPKERLKKEVREELARKEAGLTSEQPAEEGPEAKETETPDETPEPADPDAPVERRVLIYSSRKDVVIENDIIELSSELIGFDGVEVHYQWQVDRNDDKGWVDVEGATGPKHRFAATRETILYNWRLTVSVDE